MNTGGSTTSPGEGAIAGAGGSIGGDGGEHESSLGGADMDRNAPDTGSGHTPDMPEASATHLATGGEGNNSGAEPPADIGEASNTGTRPPALLVVSMATKFKLTKKEDLTKFIMAHQMASPNKSASKERKF